MKHQSNIAPENEKEAPPTADEIPVAYVAVFAVGFVLFSLIALVALMIANMGD